MSIEIPNRTRNFIIANSLKNSKSITLLDFLADENLFLSVANRKGKKRIFDSFEHDEFCENIIQAIDCAIERKPFYWEINAGIVGRSYKYKCESANCGVYSIPEFNIIYYIGRVQCNGSVRCVFHGGERSYNKWFRDKLKEIESVKC